MGKFCSRVTLFGAVMVVAATLAGCGSSGTSTTDTTSVSTTSQAVAAAKVVPVVLHLTQGSYSVSAPGTTISGTASKGASVTVNGTKAIVHSGHWHDQPPSPHRVQPD